MDKKISEKFLLERMPIKNKLDLHSFLLLMPVDYCKFHSAEWKFMQLDFICFK